LSANIDHTGFSFRKDKEIFEKWACIIADATDSTEFLEYCKGEIQNNKIPDKLLNFMFIGCRVSEITTNAVFINWLYENLEEMLENPSYVSIEKLPKLIADDSKDFSDILTSGETGWNLEFDEGQNQEEFYDYFPKQKRTLSPAFHSLTTTMGFDHKEYATNKDFHLVVSTQPPVNNRDFNMTYAQPSKSTGHSLFCYMTNHPSTANINKNEKVTLSDGHYILAKRVRREKVSDEQIKERLSPYGHMHANQSYLDPKTVNRETGVKILGDHVGVNCQYEDACQFFQVLTVSEIFSSGNESRILGKKLTIAIHNN
jgi:hypothetical protein